MGPIFPFLNQLNNCSRRKASKKNRTLLFLLRGSGDKRTFTTQSPQASSLSCWSVTQHPWIPRKLQPRWSLFEPTLLQNSDRFTVCQIYPYLTSLRTYLPRKRPQNQQKKKKPKKKKKKKKVHSRFTTQSLRASSPSCWSVTQHLWILRKLQPRWSSSEPILLQNSDRFT